jgi:hypothetical protein
MKRTRSAPGGRFAEVEATRQIMGASSYPKLSGSSPWTEPTVDAAFNASRDRIEPENVTPMTFGVDVSGRQLQPEALPASPQATSADDVEPSPAPSSAAFRKGGL